MLMLCKTAHVALEWSIVFLNLHGLNHLLVFPGSHGTFGPTTCAQTPMPLVFLLLALVPAPHYLNGSSCVQHLLHIKNWAWIEVSCDWQIVSVALDNQWRHETWTLRGFMLRTRLQLLSCRDRILCLRMRQGLSTSQMQFWLLGWNFSVNSISRGSRRGSHRGAWPFHLYLSLALVFYNFELI